MQVYIIYYFFVMIFEYWLQLKFFEIQMFTELNRIKLMNLTHLFLYSIVALTTISSCQQISLEAPLGFKRNYFLNLVNSVRAQQNLGLVTLYEDLTLDALAQFHSQDMAKRNFFSQYNPDGLSPQQRATAAGFFCQVDQSVGKGANLAALGYNMLGDATQYANAVNPKWTRMGVGVTIKENVAYVTLVYSTRDYSQYPVTNMERNDLLEKLNNEIMAQNKNLVGQAPELSDHIAAWLQQDIALNNIFNYLQAVNYKVSDSAYYVNFETNWSDNILQTIMSQGALYAQSSDLKKYGLGVYIDSKGLAKIAIVFT